MSGPLARAGPPDQLPCKMGTERHSIVKNMGGWLDSLGCGILVRKRYFGVLQNIDLDNS